MNNLDYNKRSTANPTRRSSQSRVRYGAPPARNRRSLYLAISTVLVFVLGISGTLAFISTKTTPVVNEFDPTEVACFVDESFATGDLVKSDVHVHNTGDVDAYIRATVAATWQNDSGYILGESPKLGVNYSLTLKEGSGWVKGSDGYYYYTIPVSPDGPLGEAVGIISCDNRVNGSTNILFDSCEVKTAAPVEGYSLHIEILASAIQADGVDAKGNRPIELAWGVDIEDGQLKDATIVQ